MHIAVCRCLSLLGPMVVYLHAVKRLRRQKYGQHGPQSAACLEGSVRRLRSPSRLKSVSVLCRKQIGQDCIGREKGQFRERLSLTIDASGGDVATTVTTATERPS